MTYLGIAGLEARVEGLVRGWLEKAPPPRPPAAGFLVVGHRGAPRLEAENTLASFRRALDEGANAIEADICVTRDGRFVVWHDADPNERVALARQIGGEGLLFRPDVPALGSPLRRKVCELGWEELSRNYRYVRKGAEGTAAIVMLSELLEWIPGQDRLRDVILDIKLAANQTAAAEELVDFLRDNLVRRPLPGVTFRLLSPQAEIVAALVRRCGRRNDDPLRVSADFELPGAPEQCVATGAPDVSLGLGRRLWPEFRRDVGRCVEARSRGAVGSVVAWTINDKDRLRELVRIGVDGILTDDAALLRGIAGSHRG